MTHQQKRDLKKDKLELMENLHVKSASWGVEMMSKARKINIFAWERPDD